MTERFLSISELAKLSGKDRATVREKLKVLQSKPGPKGARLYDIVEALPLLGKNPAELTAFGKDVESLISTGEESEAYSDARAEKEAYQAKLLKLKYEELSGRLVSAEDVEKKWAEIATLVKTKILGVASKVKQRHPEISLEVYETLDAIHREALEELANGEQD